VSPTAAQQAITVLGDALDAALQGLASIEREAEQQSGSFFSGGAVGLGGVATATLDEVASKSHELSTRVAVARGVVHRAMRGG
jgi:hypothetical protein